MIRNVAGFAVFAFLALLGVKLITGIFGSILGLIFTLLYWAFLGFVIYTLLKIFAPGLAQRVRDTIRGNSTTA